jgi:hypothetical protein
VKRFLLLIPLIWASASPSFAQARTPLTYEGIEVQQVLNTGTGQRVSTVFLKLANPNAEAVEVRNIHCEFYDGTKLAKQFSISRLMVQPGSDKYEAPEKVEGPFNRPVCKLGK